MDRCYSDPFDWSIDQCAAYFAQSRCVGDEDLSFFRAIIHQHDLSGDLLLSQVNPINLRDDLGIRSFGQRQRIQRVITYLRSLSRKYYTLQNDERSQVPEFYECWIFFGLVKLALLIGHNCSTSRPIGSADTRTASETMEKPVSDAGSNGLSTRASIPDSLEWLQTKDYANPESGTNGNDAQTDMMPGSFNGNANYQPADSSGKLPAMEGTGLQQSSLTPTRPLLSVTGGDNTQDHGDSQVILISDDEESVVSIKPRVTVQSSVAASVTENSGDQDGRSKRANSHLPTPSPSPTKRRRTTQTQGKSKAAKHQDDAIQRLDDQEGKRKLFFKEILIPRIAQEGISQHPVNFEPPIIYLPPHISQVIKPHQVEGIQFMFREIVTAPRREGCLLAHVMGAGKTMQVIALLLTIIRSAKSPDKTIVERIPRPLRRSATLILCPPSLVDNWREEIHRWAPAETYTGLGNVRYFVSNCRNKKRIVLVKLWKKEGGVLILGYEMFRELIDNPGKKISPKDHEEVKKCLLHGPNIVIADEAHLLANPQSKRTIACSQFKTKSRIGLTGTPMANRLSEYYSMIDWVAPGYLGKPAEFKSTYVEPIEGGMYLDSSEDDIRLSTERLAILRRKLEPKTHRVDVTQIAASLPPKIEFVLSLPLTELQKQAYTMYIESLLRRDLDDVHMNVFWRWINLLSLICNHPATIINKLKSPSGSSDDANLSGGPDSCNIFDSDVLSKRTAKEFFQLFEGVKDVESSYHSYRTVLMDQIIEQSIRVGDKVLIFSQSIPTLDLLEKFLKNKRRNFCRLDGSTPMTSRQSGAHAFNEEGLGADVYLISTKAGGLGLNITGANRVIIFDFKYNPAHEEQAIGRAYRFGQKKPVYVYRFLAGGTFEDIIYNKQVFKSHLSLRVMDQKKPIRQALKTIPEYIFPPRDIEKQDLAEFTGKDAVLDKILDGRHRIRRIRMSTTEVGKKPNSSASHVTEATEVTDDGESD